MSLGLVVARRVSGGKVGALKHASSACPSPRLLSAARLRAKKRIEQEDSKGREGQKSRAKRMSFFPLFPIFLFNSGLVGSTDGAPTAALAYPTAFNPATPATINPMHAIRAAELGSPSHNIPTIAVPTAPIPVHTA